MSDRGATFKAEWWKEYCKAIGVQLKMSTAYHPQTDGQTKKTHQSLKNMLRCYVDYAQDDWMDWLYLAEMAYKQRLPHGYQAITVPRPVRLQCTGYWVGSSGRYGGQYRT